MHLPYRRVCSIMACTLCLTVLTALQAYAEPLRLRMGLEQNPPLAGVAASGKAEGLFVDLLDEVAQLEGWRIEYVSCPQAACLAMLSDHTIDLMAPLAWSPERAQQFQFSANDIVTNWGVLYSRPGQHHNSFLDLQNHTIGIVPNDIHFLRLKQLLHNFGVTASYREYPDFERIFAALDRGEIDAGVVGRFFAMKRAAAYRIEATPIIFNPIHVHLAMAQSLDPAVVAAINTRIAELKATPNSAYHKAVQRWLHPETPFSLPLWLKAGGGAALVVLIGMFISNRLLRRSVSRQTETLAASQQLFKSIFDSTFHLQGLLATDGTLLQANRASLDFAGATEQEVVGKPFWETPWWCHDSNGQARLREMITQCAAGETVRMEVTHTNHAGELRTIDFSLKPLFSDSGVLLYLIPEGRDITEQKQFENDLQKKNAFLNTLFESIPFDLWVRDREGRLVMQNQLHAAHYGETLGTTLPASALDPQRAMSWLPDLEQILDGESLDIEMREGNRIYRKIVAPITDSGQVTAFFGLNIDISERYQMLEQLHDSERRFKAVFDEAPFIITLKDLSSTTYIDVNRYYCQFNAVTRDQVIGKPPTEIGRFISHEEHAQIETLLRQNGYVDTQNVTMTRADGEQRFGLISCRIVRIGARPCNLTVIQDITSFKKAEEALKANELQLLQLIDRAPLGIAMTDGSIIRYANDGFAQMTGHKNSLETHGQEIHTYFAPEWQEEVRNRAARRMQGEDVPTSYEATGMRRDGTLFPLQLSVVSLYQQGEPRLLIFFQDLTDQNRQRELLIQHEKMLMIGGLAAGMAHEINNPLGIIAQDLQNLQRRLLPTLPKNREVAASLGLNLDIVHKYLESREINGYLVSIREAIRRTSRIIDNMLQFSRQNGSSHQLSPLHEVIDHAVELAGGDYELRKKYDFAGIVIQRSYTPDLPMVPLNVIEIEQVLINLLKNAAQAMSDGPGDRRITIATSRDGDYALLSVCDNGPGMTDTVRQRIFEPFFTTKPVGSGTGLGLAVSHTIVTQNHKGSITVQSAPGQGSCFNIRLPLAQE